MLQLFHLPFLMRAEGMDGGRVKKGILFNVDNLKRKFCIVT